MSVALDESAARSLDRGESFSNQHDWNARLSAPHDLRYYSCCLVGGALSSSLRWLQTPLDCVKCNLQVHPHKYTSLRYGLHVLWREGSLWRGLGPTIASYSLQSGTKYGLYEVLKDQYSTLLLDDCSLVYVAAAGTAEACADVLMCPWEMLKVKVQTDPTFPQRFGPAVWAAVQQRHVLQWPFGSLGPLLARQLPGTMANFLTFETTVAYIYDHVLTEPKAHYSVHFQLGVTLCGGAVAGMVSTLVSHPADSLLSLQAKHPDRALWPLAQEAGFVHLCTKGLWPRMGMNGTILAFQWWAYDSFKTALGLGTSGGGGGYCQ